MGTLSGELQKLAGRAFPNGNGNTAKSSSVEIATDEALLEVLGEMVGSDESPMEAVSPTKETAPAKTVVSPAPKRKRATTKKDAAKKLAAPIANDTAKVESDLSLAQVSERIRERLAARSRGEAVGPPSIEMLDGVRRELVDIGRQREELLALSPSEDTLAAFEASVGPDEKELKTLEREYIRKSPPELFMLMAEREKRTRDAEARITDLLSARVLDEAFIGSRIAMALDEKLIVRTTSTTHVNGVAPFAFGRVLYGPSQNEPRLHELADTFCEKIAEIGNVCKKLFEAEGKMIEDGGWYIPPRIFQIYLELSGTLHDTMAGKATRAIVEVPGWEKEPPFKMVVTSDKRAIAMTSRTAARYFFFKDRKNGNARFESKKFGFEDGSFSAGSEVIAGALNRAWKDEEKRLQQFKIFERVEHPGTRKDFKDGKPGTYTFFVPDWMPDRKSSKTCVLAFIVTIDDNKKFRVVSADDRTKAKVGWLVEQFGQPTDLTRFLENRALYRMFQMNKRWGG